MTRAREHLTTLEDELQYTELCPCHLDLHARNIILTPSGNTILIDWVNSGLSDPALDIATLFVFLGPAKRGSRWLSLKLPSIDGRICRYGPGRATDAGSTLCGGCQLPQELACPW
ncbi:MAG: hypothetical protein CME05_00480 [Gemmatimonadaceae bacterium]|nr:hypothetical protein [Gemmatimonadaceae bacterium]